MSLNKADSPHDSTGSCATKLFAGLGGLQSRLITRRITVPPACLWGESSYWPPPPSIPIHGPPLQSLHFSQPGRWRWQRMAVNQERMIVCDDYTHHRRCSARTATNCKNGDGDDGLMSLTLYELYSQSDTSYQTGVDIHTPCHFSPRGLVEMAAHGVEVMKEERELSEIWAVQSASQQALWRLLRTALAF
ncbi:hypothetical protein DPX16_13727 [Anabarilius grahami]|uniref:Uncharacterized protein n=1 Tax=Anabarilius grahami TaxID=495550 RepID=A0A3N0XTB1_ANAGA|nr:hypothetical protein DPX16_13727 [Anabarilius grahami]